MTTHTMIDSQEGFCKWGYYGKGSSAYSENPVVQGGMCAMCNKCAKEYFGHLSRPAVSDKSKRDANGFRASQWASKRKRVEEDEDEKRTHGLTRAPKRSRFVESYKEETTRVRYAGFWVLLDVFKKSFGDPKQHKLKVEKRILFGKCCQVVFVPKHRRGWYEVDFEEANGVKEGSRTDGNQDKSDDGMISDMYNELKGKLTQCQETGTHIGILEQPGNDSESATGRGSGASVRSGQSGGSGDEAPATNGFEGLDAEYLAEMEEDAEFLERAQSSWASFAMPAGFVAEIGHVEPRQQKEGTPRQKCAASSSCRRRRPGHACNFQSPRRHRRSAVAASARGGREHDRGPAQGVRYGPGVVEERPAVVGGAQARPHDQGPNNQVDCDEVKVVSVFLRKEGLYQHAH